jgi:hypothetical protein
MDRTNSYWHPEILASPTVCLGCRRNNLSKSFIGKLKSVERTQNNPLAHIINNRPQVSDKKYNLRSLPINMSHMNTDWFRNFITIKFS